MKIIKLIGILLAAMIAIYLIISLFMPSKLSVERSIKINAPTSLVFDLVNTPRHWELWDPWVKYDTNQVRTYTDIKSSDSSGYQWKSELQSVGSGSLRITSSIADSMIKLRAVFDGQGDANFLFQFNKNDKATDVSWRIEIPMEFLFRLVGLMLRGSLEQQITEGLDKLKSTAENNEANKMISFVELMPMQIVFINDSTSDMTRVPELLGKAYVELKSAIIKSGAVINGAPMAITNRFDSAFWNFDAAFQIEKQINPKGRVRFGVIDGGLFVKARHIGPYSSSIEVYNEVFKFIKTHKLIINGRSWESYINSPNEVKPDELITEIYFPVSKEVFSDIKHE